MRTYVLYTAVVTVLLTALIIMQVFYVSRTAEKLLQQFDSNVHAALYDVSQLLEEREMRRYMDSEIYGDIDQLKAAKKILMPTTYGNTHQYNFYDETLDSKTDSVQVLSDKSVSVNDEVTIKRLSNDKERLMHSLVFVDELLMRFVYQMPSIDILDRIDKDVMEHSIQTCLYNNGVQSPFCFRVVDEYNNIYFSSSNYCKIWKENSFFYRQQLFSSDNRGLSYYLEVMMPSKDRTAFALLNLLLPSLLISVLLAIMLVFTAYYVRRQNMLSAIKTNFVNNMTHELKTPVSSISLASQMMNDSSVEKTMERMERFAKVINNESKRLNTLVEKVLYTSVLDRKDAMMSFKNLDVNKMISSVVANFSMKVDSTGGKIVSYLKAEKAIAEVDDMHFTNVLYNLMENATKYRREVPLVLTVRTYNVKDMLCISVEDNGIGMRHEDAKNIFHKFYRVSTGNIHNVKGFGLGLAYVKQIVEAHHGNIRVDSELGIGSKFVIEIPTLKN